ncbi:type II secretion system protein [Candidatus Woesebacteria bacterium]|nr:type II secretion system protein [Candidatus Woesebacteria bacterium]
MKQQGFTLIELLIVISLILFLTIMSINLAYTGRLKSRDAKRKTDLEKITSLLSAYYQAHGKYPPAVNGTTTCAYGAANCWVYSTAGEDWIQPLVPDYAPVLPVDPKNNAEDPWDLNDDNYSYAYGNVTLDGQAYDLTTRLESETDPDRCADKQYRYGFTNLLWCGAYSDQVYELSPLSP